MPNSNKLTFGFDVDHCVTFASSKWLDWLEKHCLTATPREEIYASWGEVSYNLCSYFTFPEGFNPFAFWNSEDLYDDLSMPEETVEALRKVHDAGHTIVFISYCFSEGTHTQSKCNYLRRNLPFLDGDEFIFVSARKKSTFGPMLDFFFDDRIEYINTMPLSVRCYLVDTPYAQQVAGCRPYHTVSSVAKGLEDSFASISRHSKSNRK